MYCVIGLIEKIGFDWMMIGSWLFSDIFMFLLLLWIGNRILLDSDHEVLR